MLWVEKYRAGVRPADKAGTETRDTTRRTARRTARNAARPCRSNPDYQASETGDDHRRNRKEITASRRGGTADLEGNRRVCQVKCVNFFIGGRKMAANFSCQITPTLH